tara:strand:+ start:60 stop:254 length:195 start_codon:yes stop_codon:yes gene_type:complete
MTKYKMQMCRFDGDLATYNVYRCDGSAGYTFLFDFKLLRTLTDAEKIDKLKDHLKDLEPIYFDA